MRRAGGTPNGKCSTYAQTMHERPLWSNHFASELPAIGHWNRSHLPLAHQADSGARSAECGSNTLASIRPQATGTPKLDDTGDALKLDDTQDAVLEVRRQRGRRRRCKSRRYPTTEVIQQATSHAIRAPAAQRRTRIESPTIRTAPLTNQELTFGLCRTTSRLRSSEPEMPTNE
jgi:hypothetical protein